MPHILVPADNPKEAENTIKNASLMAKRLDMGLILYHTLPLPMDSTAIGPTTGVYGMLEARQDQVQKELMDILEKVTHGEKPTFRTMVTYGIMTGNMKQIEKDNDIAMVVMYSKEQDNVMQGVASSNTFNIIQEMDCPVLVLPRRADISKMKSIALAGDFMYMTEPRPLQQLIEITRNFFAHIEVIHLQKEDAMEEVLVSIGRGIGQHLKDVPHTFHFKKYSDLKNDLLAFCLENEVDLLVLVPKQKALLKELTGSSHSQGCVHEVSVPLMVLQEVSN